MTCRSHLYDFLVENLTLLSADLTLDDYERTRLNEAIGVADSLRLAERLGPSMDANDLDDITEMTGTRPFDFESGRTQLLDLVHSRRSGHRPGGSSNASTG